MFSEESHMSSAVSKPVSTAPVVTGQNTFLHSVRKYWLEPIGQFIVDRINASREHRLLANLPDAELESIGIDPRDVRPQYSADAFTRLQVRTMRR